MDIYMEAAYGGRPTDMAAGGDAMQAFQEAAARQLGVRAERQQLGGRYQQGYARYHEQRYGPEAVSVPGAPAGGPEAKAPTKFVDSTCYWPDITPELVEKYMAEANISRQVHRAEVIKRQEKLAPDMPEARRAIKTVFSGVSRMGHPICSPVKPQFPDRKGLPWRPTAPAKVPLAAAKLASPAVELLELERPAESASCFDTDEPLSGRVSSAREEWPVVAPNAYGFGCNAAEEQTESVDAFVAYTTLSMEWMSLMSEHHRTVESVFRDHQQALEPANVAKTALSRRQNKKKAKEEPLVESAVAGNTTFRLECVAQVEFEGGHCMQGYLRRGAGCLLFITGRHKYDGDDVVDAFSSRPTKVKAVLRRMTRKPVEVTCDQFMSDICTDKLQFRLSLSVKELAKQPRFGNPRLGAAVTGYFLDSLGEWQSTAGVVEVLLPTGVFLYSMTTQPGCCRMAIIQDGAIVGGHYFGRVTAEGKQYPAAFPDDGKLCTVWEDSYNPMCEAQSEPLVRAFPHQRTEKFKICPLRHDVPLDGVKTPYFMAKPSTEMLAKEIQKFLVKKEVTRPSGYEAKWKAAQRALLYIERDAATPFIEPTLELALEIVRTMDGDHTNAGAEAVGLSHKEYLTELGDGDLEKGIQEAAEEVIRVYHDIVATGKAAEVMELLRVWMVQGKRDGYSLLKVDQGRSIQAPTFTLKALWRVCFGEGDQGWVQRDTHFRVGKDFDKPVSYHHREEYRKARSAVGLDEKDFDRGIDRDMLIHFFYVYLRAMYPGVPYNMLECLFVATCDSLLVLTDGRALEKEHGNPSGFPNTLRLNCVVQLLSWLFVLAILLDTDDADDLIEFFIEHIYLEICGDDSRCWVLTPFAAEVLGEASAFNTLLQAWDAHLPWVVKIEGLVVYTEGQEFTERMNLAPPLISRKLIVIDGFLWSPLFNANRVCRKLVSDEGRTPEQEAVLRISYFMTMAPMVFWHERGLVHSPTIQTFIENGWYTAELRRLVMTRVAELYQFGHLFVGRL
jgi:hypothetical protein